MLLMAAGVTPPGRPARGARKPSGGHASEVALEEVEAAGEAVDGVDDPFLVDEHVVDLGGAGRRAGGRWRHEVRHLPRMEGVANVVHAYPGVEERAHQVLLGTPGHLNRVVLVQVVGAEASTSVAEVLRRREGGGAQDGEVALHAAIDQP